MDELKTRLAPDNLINDWNALQEELSQAKASKVQPALELQKQYDQLTKDYNNILTENTVLRSAANPSATGDFDALKVRFTALQNIYNNLERDYQVLSDNRTQLVKEFQELASSYEKLQGEELQSTYVDLLKEYNDLKDAYADLEQENIRLREELEEAS